MPGLQLFLDLDDLKQGTGAEQVLHSQALLVFVSAGYFGSINCMVRRARSVSSILPHPQGLPRHPVVTL